MKKKLFLLGLLCLFPLFGCDKDDTGTNIDTNIPSEDIVEESEVVLRAKAELGKPYAWAGVGPDSYDASGFVCYCPTGEHTRS